MRDPVHTVKIGVFMKPTFSVITPSLRQSDWLKLCAASIADQEGVALEHIVQDAGTGAELESWAAGRSGLRLCVEKDDGMYDAVNRGLRKSTGEILAYLNCDEQYLPGTLAAVRDFFAAHPEVDIAFGDAIVVDGNGGYHCSRQVVLPGLHHTQICTLGGFTACTFFRRSLIDQHGLFFSPEWRVTGDAMWVVDLLRKKIPMAVLRRFTSTFTETGDNLSTKPGATTEASRMREMAPNWAQRAAPLWALGHRFRRLLAGVYFPEKLRYSIYTPASPDARIEFKVDAPTFVWRGR